MRHFLLCTVACVIAACGTPSPPIDAANDLHLPDAADARDTSSVDTIDVGLDSVVDATDAADITDAVIDVTNDTGTVDSSLDSPVSDAAVWSPYGDAGCNGRIRSVTPDPGFHVDPDAGPITWSTDPPCSGTHYPIWAHWGAFPSIPPGYWVHNLEHGGVVFLYQCPTGTCDSLVSQLQTVAATIPDDSACVPTDAAPTRIRLVTTDYPIPDAAFAAVSWGWIYEADCIDPAALRQFFIDHHGMAPENECFDGYYP